MRVLFVKLTSMGDLIHALPAITDAARAIPGITFDWVIEKGFSDIAKWHPAVKKIIPTSHRKWKKNFYQSIKNGEIKNFIQSVRQEKYDLVIDGQTSIKSALTMLFTRGLRCGLDKNSSREWVAHLAYHKKFAVEKNMHAITRLRLLFSQIFDYPLPNHFPDYGIAKYRFSALPFDLPKPYVVFVHNASWQSKLWPEAYWRQLIVLAARENLNVLLPWGNETERLRAMRIAKHQPNAYVLPFCSLSQHAAILQGSQGAICSDTGLSHLAAALNIPAVTMYGSTSAKLIGTTGLNQKHKITPFSCKGCYKHDCNYDQKPQEDPLCLLAVKPQMLWDEFVELSM